MRADERARLDHHLGPQHGPRADLGLFVREGHAGLVVVVRADEYLAVHKGAGADVHQVKAGVEGAEQVHVAPDVRA
eukprot:1176503-Prorocentrum_minimum.AAC.2